MKLRPHVLVMLVVLVFAGCESLSEATRAVRGGRSARDEFKTRTYAAEPRPTYEAVRTAAVGMGYRFIRGGPAQGEFEAISAVQPGETHGTARQLSMKVGLHATLDGKGTDVTVRLKEILEADSSNRAGQATETPLRDTPQYDVFFRRVGAILGVPPQDDASGRPL